MKVGKDIVAEINKAKKKEKHMQLMKIQMNDNPNIAQPIELKSSIPDINFDFQTKYPNSRYMQDFEEISMIGRGG